MIEWVVHISVVAIVGVVCSLVLKKHTPELALLLILIAGIWMLLAVADGLESITEWMNTLSELSGVDQELLEPVLKTVMIAILTNITGEVCRCAGEGGLAAFVETAGTIVALTVALPLIGGVVDLMVVILK